MSASLVGSEMCIRDSMETGTDMRKHAQARADTCRRDSDAHLPIPRTTGAVSYTHLTLPTICSV
eukprot:3835688-Alexandrium_andersonii.AAC.1